MVGTPARRARRRPTRVAARRRRWARREFFTQVPCVPNKRAGSVCIGGKIAPIFFNTMEDAGALPIEMDVTQMNMGDVIDVYPFEGVAKSTAPTSARSFSLKTERDPGRGARRWSHPLIIGRGLTARARASLGMATSTSSRCLGGSTRRREGLHPRAEDGRPRVRQGRRPPRRCIASRDDHRGLAGHDRPDDARRAQGPGVPRLLGRPRDAVLLPHGRLPEARRRPTTHHTLPDFIMNRGGVSLRPGDGIIHSWLNRMLLPDTVGTGGDSHTRFPIGISFPAGSGLVAFAAATGVMPLDMPESVLVRFTGDMQPGITLRDLVHAIPYAAIQRGLLTVEKQGKKNVFSGRILEIEGLGHLKCEQAFELSLRMPSAGASLISASPACTIKLDKEPIAEYLTSNIVMLKWMIAEGYGDRAHARAAHRARWSSGSRPQLLEADAGAEYAEDDRDQHGRDQGAHPLRAQRPRRRADPLGGRRAPKSTRSSSARA